MAEQKVLRPRALVIEGRNEVSRFTSMLVRTSRLKEVTGEMGITRGCGVRVFIYEMADKDQLTITITKSRYEREDCKLRNDQITVEATLRRILLLRPDTLVYVVLHGKEYATRAVTRDYYNQEVDPATFSRVFGTTNRHLSVALVPQPHAREMLENAEYVREMIGHEMRVRITWEVREKLGNSLKYLDALRALEKLPLGVGDQERAIEWAKEELRKIEAKTMEILASLDPVILKGLDMIADRIPTTER